MKKMMMLTTTAYMSERFNRSNILILENMGYEVHVVANFENGNPTTEDVLRKFKVWIEEHHGKWFSISVTKNPTDVKKNYRAYRQILNLIEEHKYEFIHCHTPVGGVLGRVCAHRTQTYVIYTAHGFHFYKGAPIKNWLLYYPVEWFLSHWTNVLITINKEDYDRAKKRMHARSLKYIPGIGVDLNRMKLCELKKSDMRKEYGIPEGVFMLLSVGELNKNKNHMTVIKALAKLNYPDIFYYIAGTGCLEEEYKKQIKEMNMDKNIVLLGYRDDIALLCQAADCFVHPSLREGLGIAPLEAMACGLPLISSYVGGIKDYTEDGISGCCVNPTKVDEMKNAIEKMYTEPEFCKKCAINNRKTAQRFGVDESIKIMNSIYKSVILQGNLESGIAGEN